MARLVALLLAIYVGTVWTTTAFLPFSLEGNTGDRISQVNVLVSNSASIYDFESQYQNVTLAFADFLERSGLHTSPVVIDANIYDLGELSLNAKGRMDIILDVPLGSTISRYQLNETLSGAVYWEGIKTNISTLPLRYNLFSSLQTWKIQGLREYGEVWPPPKAPYITVYLVFAKQSIDTFFRIRVKHAIAFLAGVSPARVSTYRTSTFAPPVAVYQEASIIIPVMIQLMSSNDRATLVTKLQKRSDQLQAALAVMTPNSTLITYSIDSSGDTIVRNSTRVADSADLPKLIQPLGYHTASIASDSATYYLLQVSRLSSFTLRTIYDDVLALLRIINQPRTNPFPYFQFNQFKVNTTPPTNDTTTSNSTLLLEIFFNVTNDADSDIQQAVQAIADSIDANVTAAWQILQTSATMVVPTSAAAWYPYVSMTCNGSQDNWIAHQKFAFSSLFQVPYDDIQCTLWEAGVSEWEILASDPWLRQSIYTRHNKEELRDSIFDLYLSSPLNCSLNLNADGVYLGTPPYLPSSWSPWNEQDVDEKSCGLKQLYRLTRPNSQSPYGIPPSGTCSLPICLTLNLMATALPPLVLDMYEAPNTNVFVAEDSTALLLDSYASWLVQSSSTTLDISLYFRGATTTYDTTSSNTSLVDLGLHIYVAWIQNKLDISIRTTNIETPATYSSYTTSGGSITLNVQLPSLNSPTQLLIPNPECTRLRSLCNASQACTNYLGCLSLNSTSSNLLESSSTKVHDTVNVTDSILTCYDAADPIDENGWDLVASYLQCIMYQLDSVENTTALMTSLKQPTKAFQRMIASKETILDITLDLRTNSITLHNVSVYTRSQTLQRSVSSFVGKLATQVEIVVTPLILQSEPLIEGWELKIMYTNYIGRLPRITTMSGNEWIEQIEPHTFLVVEPFNPISTWHLPSIAGTIVGTSDECTPCHALRATCYQSRECMEVEQCVGPTSVPSLLDFPSRHSYSISNQTMLRCFDNSQSMDGWILFINVLNCFIESHCPMKTNGVDRMIYGRINSGFQWIQLTPGSSATLELKFNESMMVLVTLPSKSSDIATKVNTMLTSTGLLHSNFNVYSYQNETSWIIELYYGKYLGRLPKASIMSSKPVLRMRTSLPELLYEVEELELYNYIIVETPCACDPFTCDSSIYGESTCFNISNVVNRLNESAQVLFSSNPTSPVYATDTSSLLQEGSLPPSFLYYLSCISALQCPYHSAPDASVLLSLEIADIQIEAEIYASDYSIEIGFGPVAIIRWNETTSADDIHASLAEQYPFTFKTNVSIEENGSTSSLVRITLPYLAGPIPHVSIVSIAKAAAHITISTIGNQQLNLTRF